MPSKDQSKQLNENHRPLLGVCAPSRAVCTQELDGTLDTARIDSAVRHFKDLGWDVLEATNTRLIEQRFAGSDEERVAGMHALFSNPDVDLVMALRGGYGATRILDKLDYKLIGASDAPLVGLSDVTAVELAMLSIASKPSWQGPTFARYADPNAQRDASFASMTQEGAWVTAFSTESGDIEVKGTLWGGNLSILTSLIGTPYFPAIDNGILLIEDVAEPAWRVERMLMTLHHAGFLQHQKAILAGSFTNADRGEGTGSAQFSLSNAFEHISEIASLPVITGLPFGHIASSITVPIGVEACLQVKCGVGNVTVKHPPRPTAVPHFGNWWN